jgi:hypothetical protein
MSPTASTAMLGNQRLMELGLYVDACTALPIVFPVTGTWYQRTAAWLELLPATVWLSHSDSTLPTFEYWFCIISRIGNVSRSVPLFSGTVPGGPDQVDPVSESVGPVKVELAGVAQSTWKRHTWSRSV